MTSEPEFRVLLAADPADTHTRGVLADFLDDRGEHRRAALERVLADPASDAKRLAYATACEAEGDVARAEFVRVQVEIANLPKSARNWLADSQEMGGSLIELLPHITFTGATPEQEKLLREEFRRLAELQKRESDLLNAHAAPGIPALAEWGPKPVKAFTSEFRRGFVESVTCSAADWLATDADGVCAGDRIRNLHPVTKVVLTGELPRVPLPLKISRTQPHYADIKIADRIVRLNEKEICLLRAAGTFAAETDFIEAALEKRWPGITFELPPPIVDSSWDAAPATATPLTDLRAMQERLREHSEPLETAIRRAQEADLRVRHEVAEVVISLYGRFAAGGATWVEVQGGVVPPAPAFRCGACQSGTVRLQAWGGTVQRWPGYQVSSARCESCPQVYVSARRV